MSLLTIGTFNVNSVKSRLPVLEYFLRGENAPDILCLQETKCTNENFPLAFFEQLGYNAVFRGMKSYNGVAVISRVTPEEYFFGLDDGAAMGPLKESEESRVIYARFGDLHILNTYVPQGKELDNPDYAYKLNFLGRVKKLLERRFKPADKVLWTGDINVAPTDLDVTHPENKRNHVCFHKDVKEKLEDVKAWGLSDIFRRHRPGAGEFSFWDYRVPKALERNIGWRIDHILGTESVAKASADAWAVRELRAMEKPSDHTAVMASFNDMVKPGFNNF